MFLLSLFCRVSFGQVIWLLSFIFFICKIKTVGKIISEVLLSSIICVYTIVKWGNRDTDKLSTWLSSYNELIIKPWYLTFWLTVYWHFPTILMPITQTLLISLLFENNNSLQKLCYRYNPFLKKFNIFLYFQVKNL